MLVLIRGGGDLASGVALRLHRSGIEVVITELHQPLVVRRTVAFAEAIWERQVMVEDVSAVFIKDPHQIKDIIRTGQIPVLVDPDLEHLNEIRPDVVVDARMLKKPQEDQKGLATLVIGLGPGFIAGENCHAVVETLRGHFLGRVIWAGPPQENTGKPGEILGRSDDRVLRAPETGKLVSKAKICDPVKSGTVIALIGSQAILAPYDGILRGLIRPGTHVVKGTKVGDVDPRLDPLLCNVVSEKALAVAGGVLEAILACPDLRSGLWI